MQIKDIQTMATLSDFEMRELFRKMLKLTENVRGATPAGCHELDVIQNVLKFSMARLKEPDRRGIANDNPTGHPDIK
ncbi:hypothetical protein [Phyllobacterium myrsinacearum]|uniref:Uncharacterized protein n=1 Tax=Phyllobacterium myrsinacearum TaxID=28101 RepID=A0A839ES94_9HYPH|nr:hypothetical protein [Phyllobacterium myrsinacearum]MBA8879480.1 hypothetical protein [Phyllobacterium myrsinacearum]